ncbi:YcaO-like family protein [Metabacillus indicus]|uniref:YcaO-like family protein n=1 Tax=Metabacillus indicus TaxID=246786 RepID=UPI002A003866|nr:YcaO-like family protein [Metabacillus indicus]MDX8288695.1 YcaO-like family protein [Metabacillus indicus]
MISKKLEENLYNTYIYKEEEFISAKKGFLETDYIVITFINVIILFRGTCLLKKCPNCLILYLLDNEEIITMVKQDEISVDHFDINRVNHIKLKSIMFGHLLTNNIVIVDSNNYDFLEIKQEKVVKHYICNCDYVPTVAKSLSIEDLCNPMVGIIRTTEMINEKIHPIINNRFFIDHFVYFSYFYHPLALINDEFGPLDMSIGIDVENEVAKTKSRMEALERFCTFVPKEKKYIDKKNKLKLLKDFILPRGTSNGIAAHHSLNKANEGALCEIAERHSLMDSWINKKNINFLSVSSLPPRFLGYLEDLLRMDYKVSIVYLTNRFGVCTFLIIIVQQNQHNKFLPYVKSGIGSSLDNKELALDKAFGELLIGLYFDLNDKNWHSTPSEYGFEFHIDYYNCSDDKENKYEMVKHYFSENEADTINWSDIECDKEWANEEISFVDLKPKFLDQYNFEVVKAVVKNTFPLYYHGSSYQDFSDSFSKEQYRYLEKNPHPFP